MNNYLSQPTSLEEREAALQSWNLDHQAAEAFAQSDIPAAISSEPAVDAETMATLRALDETGDLVLELIELYLTDAPAQVEIICQAVERRDAYVLQRTAHTLKGSSANMGARGMAAVCLKLEQAGRNGTVGDADEILPQLQFELERARQALEAERSAEG